MAMPSDWKKESDSKKENTEGKPKKVKIGEVAALVDIMAVVSPMYRPLR